MAKLVAEMMQAVRKVNTKFFFGMYPYAPFRYYDALIRGGTPELPALLFSSAEYPTGYTAERDSNPTFFGDTSTAASIAHIRRSGLNALYDKGIRSPEAYALAMDRLLRAEDGLCAYRELRGRGFKPLCGPLSSRLASDRNQPLEPTKPRPATNWRHAGGLHTRRRPMGS